VRHTASESILEDLLKAQELENGQVDRRVQAQTALVGAERRVELHAVALVDLAVALVVLPDDAELDDALGDRDYLEGLFVLGVLLEKRRILEGGDELWGALAAIDAMKVVWRTLARLLELWLRHCELRCRYIELLG
jgi:hypothetical protein